MEKQIKDFPDYYIHADGYVISRKHGKERKMVGGSTGTGYPQVTLRHNGVQVQRLVHRLVAEHFVDAVDTEGNPVYQGIDTSFLVATLTKAIQELSAKNDALEARITALEAK